MELGRVASNFLQALSFEGSRPPVNINQGNSLTSRGVVQHQAQKKPACLCGLIRTGESSRLLFRRSRVRDAWLNKRGAPKFIALQRFFENSAAALACLDCRKVSQHVADPSATLGPSRGTAS
jgi:hypothetical protein